LRTDVVGNQEVSGPRAFSDVTASLVLKQPLNKAKAARLVLQDRDGKYAPVEWSLSMPQGEASKSKLVAVPMLLSLGDSQTVVLSGLDFSNAKDVLFEGQILVLTSQSKSKAEFTVPETITKTTGKKEFTLEMNGTDQPMRFTITVQK
jgi:hypothetical protein